MAATALLVFIIATLAITNARPNHFGETNQVVGDQDSNNLSQEPGWKPWQLELMAQRLSEISNQAGGDYGYDKSLRLPEIKRQIRYRQQCYFNPISCFRK